MLLTVTVDCPATDISRIGEEIGGSGGEDDPAKEAAPEESAADVGVVSGAAAEAQGRKADSVAEKKMSSTSAEGKAEAVEAAEAEAKARGSADTGNSSTNNLTPAEKRR